MQGSTDIRESDEIYMRRIVLSYTLAALVASVFSAAKAVAADWKKEVVYQVFTDRFYNGNTNNDDPEGSKGLFDKTKTNWAAYWGGDLEGIRQKLDYKRGLVQPRSGFHRP